MLFSFIFKDLFLILIMYMYVYLCEGISTRVCVKKRRANALDLELQAVVHCGRDDGN